MIRNIDIVSEHKVKVFLKDRMPCLLCLKQIEDDVYDTV